MFELEVCSCPDSTRSSLVGRWTESSFSQHRPTCTSMALLSYILHTHLSSKHVHCIMTDIWGSLNIQWTVGEGVCTCAHWCMRLHLCSSMAKQYMLHCFVTGCIKVHLLLKWKMSIPHTQGVGLSCIQTTVQRSNRTPHNVHISSLWLIICTSNQPIGCYDNIDIM